MLCVQIIEFSAYTILLLNGRVYTKTLSLRICYEMRRNMIATSKTTVGMGFQIGSGLSNESDGGGIKKDGTVMTES